MTAPLVVYTDTKLQSLKKRCINATLSRAALMPHAAALLIVDCIIVSEKHSVKSYEISNTIECHVTMASRYSNCCYKCNFTKQRKLNLTHELGYERFRKTSPTSQRVHTRPNKLCHERWAHIMVQVFYACTM